MTSAADFLDIGQGELARRIAVRMRHGTRCRITLWRRLTINTDGYMTSATKFRKSCAFDSYGKARRGIVKKRNNRTGSRIIRSRVA